jgi:UPF0716 protein FxsA
MSKLTLIIFSLTVALPLLELALLIKIGSIIGVLGTLVIIISTAILGALVVRHQGLGVLKRMRQTIQSGKPPVEPMMEGMLLMMAGGCLIAPGILTDIVGLVLLVPAIRQIAARAIVKFGNPFIIVDPNAKHAGPRMRTSTSTPEDRRRARRGQPEIIDVPYERVDEPAVDKNPPAIDGPARPPTSTP